MAFGFSFIPAVTTLCFPYNSSFSPMINLNFNSSFLLCTDVDPYASSFGPGVVIGNSTASGSSGDNGSGGEAAVLAENEVGTTSTSAVSRMQESEADLVTV